MGPQSAELPGGVLSLRLGDLHPLSFFGGIGGASKHGILVKGSNYLEALARAGIVVFDKTGTLTRGTFEVTVIHPQQLSEQELLELAALAEHFSTHPISLSIQAACRPPQTGPGHRRQGDRRPGRPGRGGWQDRAGRQSETDGPVPDLL